MACYKDPDTGRCIYVNVLCPYLQQTRCTIPNYIQGFDYEQSFNTVYKRLEHLIGAPINTETISEVRTTITNILEEIVNATPIQDDSSDLV